MVGEEVIWARCEREVMITQVFQTIAFSFPTDVTLVTEDGEKFEAHSVILKASSPIFKSILKKTKVDEESAAKTIIYMPGLKHTHLASIVELVYFGRVTIAEPFLEAFLDTALSLGLLRKEPDKVDIVGKHVASEFAEIPPGVEKDADDAEEGEIVENNGGESDFIVKESCVKSEEVFEESSLSISLENESSSTKEAVEEADFTTRGEQLENHFEKVSTEENLEKHCEIKVTGETNNIIENEEHYLERQIAQSIIDSQDVEEGSKGVFKKKKMKKSGEFDSVNPMKKTKEKNDSDRLRGKVKEMTCEICGKHYKVLPFRKRNRYNMHMRRHQVLSHDCGCGIDFASFNEKRRHMRVVHQGYLDCGQCTQSFSNEKFLKDHKTAKHPEKKDEKDLFTCHVCDKTFAHNKILAYHISRSHSDEGPFICGVCGKELSNKYALHYHEKKVHNPETCPTCHKEVKNLRRHNLTSHTDNSLLKFKCDICGKGFGENAILRNHEMNVHIKSRPFRCRYNCENDIGYNDLSNRNSHEKKKHGGVFPNAK